MKTLVTGLSLLLSLQVFAWNNSTQKECPTKIHVNSTLDFPEPVTGYGYTSFDVSGNLDSSYATVLKAGQYQLTALMAFEKAKKVKGKVRCLYHTEGVVVKGENFIEKIHGRGAGRDMQGWIQLDKENQIERASIVTISLSSVENILAKDGNYYPTLYNAFNLTLYGNKVVAQSDKKIDFVGTLMEIDYSSGHREYATSKVTLTSLDK